MDKIVAGRLDKYYADECLLEQAFIMDADLKVGTVSSQLFSVHCGTWKVAPAGVSRGSALQRCACLQLHFAGL